MHSHVDVNHVGMWHMMNVRRQGKGEFNDIPGTQLIHAGQLFPGEMDLILTAATALGGLTYDAVHGKGDDRYGPHDDYSDKRDHYWDWQVDTIGVMEWSSLSSLGEFGWAEFTDNPTGSRYLGWPLHAIGDTIIPHHIFGTTSWGHHAYESAMDEAWPRLFWGEEKSVSSEATMDGDKDEDEVNIIRNGYKWWKEYCWDTSSWVNQTKKDLESAKELIEAVAIENAAYVNLWAWDDWQSVAENTSDEGKMKKVNRYLAKDAFWENARSMVANSSGAALALLMCAADMVESDGSPSDTKCEEGYEYCMKWECGFQCTLTDEEPTIPPVFTGLVPFAEKTCQYGACSSDDDCEGATYCNEDDNCCYFPVVE